MVLELPTACHDEQDRFHRLFLEHSDLLMDSSFVDEIKLDQVPWQQLQALLDSSYPRPPRDVFGRVVAFSHSRPRFWVCTNGDGLLGMVMLSPHSKGGHLDNLAVTPIARGRGIGQKLVQTLLQDVCQEGPSMVSLTTRIPAFFSPFGFQPCGQLTDSSSAMLILLTGPVVLEHPTR